MPTRYFGILKATINHKAKTVKFSISRGPEKVSDATIERLKGWALGGVRDLERAGYQIDAGRLER